MMKLSSRSSFARQMRNVAASILVLTFTGWLAGLRDLSGSCSGWPMCWPATAGGWLHVVHRILALVAGSLVLVMCRTAWREQRRHLVILPLATFSTIMFFGQVFVGALEATAPPPHLRALHALTTISLWTCLTVLLLVSTALPEGEKEHLGDPSSSRHLRDFLGLTKPWIVVLLLVTTLAGMVVAYQGLPRASLMLWTLVGGALAAGGSSALNQYIDRDLDRRMQRTSQRPLAAGRLTDAEGLAFGLALCTASYYILAGLVNLLAAVLSLVGIFYYVLVYSIWLKKATVQNIVIGGGAGAIPPMVGWAAATGHLPLAAWILFALVFVWTPPHFWALAIVRKKDYERAGVPMLPVVHGETETRRQILLYTIVLVAVSLLLPALQLAGSIYLSAALLLGGGLLYAAWKVWRVPGNKVAFVMYRWSSMYLLFIFIALMVDALHRHG